MMGPSRWVTLPFLVTCFVLGVWGTSPQEELFNKMLSSPTEILEHEYITTSAIINNHRVRRGSFNRTNSIREVNFDALGKKFRMVLNENNDLLSPKFRAYVVDGEGNKRRFYGVNAHDFYEGRLRGQPKSRVSAHLDSDTGLLTASILDKDGSYFVEPNGWKKSDTMIVFKGTNLKWNGTEEYKLHDFIKLDETGEEVTHDDQSTTTTNDQSSSADQREEMEPHNRYRRSDNEINDFVKTPSRCALHLFGDHLFYKQHGRDVKQSISYMVSVIDRINQIYLYTDFADTSKGESAMKGYGFLIQDITINQEPSTEIGHYNSFRDWNIRDLLESFSREKDHKHYCLSHLFTHQRFNDGVLGLAFVASSRRLVPGGICPYGVNKGGKTSYYNTGVTTTKNSYNQAIFTRVTDLITAHELGHNWGAEHDPDSIECSPKSGSGGSFLMHAYSLAGYDSNNKVFSPCSKRAINQVLKNKAQTCFAGIFKRFCGNGIQEENEECDVGDVGNNDGDLCCDINCRLKPDAECSDMNSVCCEGCRHRAPQSLCREGNPLDCTHNTMCDGFSPKCPAKSPSVDNNNECLDGGKCHDGKCVSFCESRGLIPCMCDNRNHLCLRCCRNDTPNSVCLPYDEDKPNDVLKDGTPCIYGYCNNGRCDRITQDVIRRLWNVRDQININSFFVFLKDNIVLCVIILLALMWIPLSFLIKKHDDQNKALLQEEQKRMRNRTTYDQFDVVDEKASYRTKK